MKKKEKRDSRPKSKACPTQTTGTGSCNAGQAPYLAFIFSQNLIPIILIATLALLLYANALKNGFVYDDDYTIVNNDFIKNLDNFPKLFSKEDYHALSFEQSYRPVVTLTYFTDYALYGLRPWGFHLSNILIHAANGILLYMFLTLVIRPSPVNPRQPMIYRIFDNTPLLITFLFVAHPALTEAVNAISNREDLLTFLFIMATLLLYMTLRPKPILVYRFSTFKIYLFSCLTYSLALLSKETAATLPLIVYCFEWINRDIKNRDFRSILINRYNIGYIGITILYLYLNFYHFHNPAAAPPPATWGGFTERFATMPWLLISFLKLAVFPVSLSADYVFSLVKTASSPMFIAPAIIVTIFLIMAFKMNKPKKNFAFGIFFFIITLLPVSNIIPIYNPLAERHLYLPMVGILLVIGQAVLVIRETQTIKAETRNIVTLILLSGILAIYSHFVIKRNNVWKDGYTLWSDTARKMPFSSRSHNNLGVAYSNLGRLEEAIQHYKITIKLKPDYFEAYNNLGSVYLKQGKFNEAISEFMTAISIQPAFPEAYNNIGNAYIKLGKLDTAIRQYQVAIKLKPDFSDAHYNLGLVYIKQGKVDDAKTEFQAASKAHIKGLSPEAHNSLGINYANQGMLDEAMQELQTALRLKADYSEAHSNLGSVYANKGMLDEAMQEFQTALSLNPDESKYNYNIGNIYHNMEQLDEAIQYYQAALTKNSDFVEAHYSLGVVYIKKGLKDKGKIELESAIKLRPGFEPAIQVLQSF